MSRIYLGIIGCLAAVGCDGSAGGTNVKLAAADGTVTYKGGPLAGATVTFIPANGPLAMATTDLSGKFTLSSGAMPGCAVGEAKVSVSVAGPADSASNVSSNAKPGGMTAEQIAEQQKKMAEATKSFQAKADAAPAKSLIPQKYDNPQTSGLSYTIKPDGDNHFKIELQD